MGWSGLGPKARPMQGPIMYTPSPSPRPKFLSLSLYDEPFLSYTTYSEKCTEWPQMTFTCSRSKIPICMLQTPPRPKFSSVSLYDEPFSIYRPIFGKVHRMTPNHLDMFKVKNTNMCATNTPEAQISVRFALWWAVFELWPNFRKSALNDPKWPWHVPSQKYQHVCYIDPQGPNFQSVSLYNEPFLSCGLIFRENSRLFSSEKVVFLPQVVEIELIFALRAPASKIQKLHIYCKFINVWEGLIWQFSWPH